MTTTLSEEQLAELAEMRAASEPEPEDEPEEEEEETSDVLEPEPEPATDMALAELTKGLDRESRRHEKALEKLHGADWDAYGLCPLCIGDGFLLPHPAGSLPAEQWEAIRALAGQLIPPDYQTAKDVDVCQDCQGWGRVITGSKAEGHETKLCSTCSGNGYTPKGTQYAPVSIPSAPSFPGMTAPLNGNENLPKDEWGRPAGHPRFGISPEHTGGVW